MATSFPRDDNPTFPGSSRSAVEIELADDGVLQASSLSAHSAGFVGFLGLTSGVRKVLLVDRMGRQNVQTLQTGLHGHGRLDIQLRDDSWLPASSYLPEQNPRPSR